MTKKKSSIFEIVFMSVISFFLIIMQGYRSNAFTFVLCLAVVYINKNKIKTRRIVLMGIVGIVLLEMFGFVRSYLSSSSVTSQLSFYYSLRNTLIVNSSNLNYVMETFPSKTPFQYGKTYFMNFALLLPGAGMDFTMWLKEQVGISFAGGGRTPSILGEAYLNFGKWFVFPGMFVMGCLGQALSKYSIKHKFSFLSVYLMWQFAHSASGGIANVILPVTIYIVIYIFIISFPIFTNDSKFLNHNKSILNKGKELNEK